MVHTIKISAALGTGTPLPFTKPPGLESETVDGVNVSPLERAGGETGEQRTLHAKTLFGGFRNNGGEHFNDVWCPSRWESNEDFQQTMREMEKRLTEKIEDYLKKGKQYYERQRKQDSDRLNEEMLLCRERQEKIQADNENLKERYNTLANKVTEISTYCHGLTINNPLVEASFQQALAPEFLVPGASAPGHFAARCNTPQCEVGVSTLATGARGGTAGMPDVPPFPFLPLTMSPPQPGSTFPSTQTPPPPPRNPPTMPLSLAEMLGTELASNSTNSTSEPQTTLSLVDSLLLPQHPPEMPSPEPSTPSQPMLRSPTVSVVEELRGHQQPPQQPQPQQQRFADGYSSWSPGPNGPWMMRADASVFVPQEAEELTRTRTQ